MTRNGQVALVTGAGRGIGRTQNPADIGEPAVDLASAPSATSEAIDVDGSTELRCAPTRT